MKLIESKTLGSAQASIEFTSIPQDGTDLVAVCSIRSTDSNLSIYIRPNGSTSNLSSRNLQGNGSVINNFSGTTIQGLATSSGNTANTFGNTSFYIPNYANTATVKSFSVDTVSETNATEAYQRIVTGVWSDTTAISSLQFWPDTGNFAAGSIISLYKITKGSDGIVTTSP
jgi:hypothetical protein